VLFAATSLTWLDRLSDPYGWFHDIFKLVIHPIWGLGFFVIINQMVRSEQRRVKTRLGTPRLVAGFASVGMFSYSLYLTHELLITYTSEFVQERYGISTALVMSALIPLSVVLAWCYFHLVEKHFVNPPASSMARRNDASQSRTVSPRERLVTPAIEKH